MRRTNLLPLVWQSKTWRALVLGLAFSLPVTSVAVAVEWVGAAGVPESWLEDANWSGDVPDGFEEALINNGGTAQLSGFGEASVLRMGVSGGSGRLEIEPGGELSATQAVIGQTSDASIDVNDGIMFIGNDSIFVGWQPGGVGEMTMRGADTLVVSGDDFQLGREGTGTLNFENGRLEAGYTVIGKFGTGIWNQSGGLFAQAFGDVEIGDGGTNDQAGTAGPRTGDLSLTGGIMHIAGDFAIGNRRGGGEAAISGGILSVTGSDNGDIFIGKGADSSPGVGLPVSLRVTGSDALIYANGGLFMNTEEVATSSTLIAEITGEEHSTIFVGGSADVTNGTLKIELNGHTPSIGDSWVLVQTAADLEGFNEIVDDAIDDMGYDPVTHNFPIEEGEVLGPFASVDLSAVANYAWNVEYTEDSIIVSVTDIIGTTGADFNGDGVLDGADINELTSAIVAGSTDGKYDLDADSAVAASDIAAWLDEKNTWVGDVNMDGSFDSSDLVSLFAVGKYESGEAAVWTEGDFNADGQFGSGDLVSAFAGGGYEQGPRTSVAAVPEPAGVSLFALALLAVPFVRSKR